MIIEEKKLTDPVAIKAMEKLRADGVFDSYENLKRYVDAHREKRRNFFINQCFRKRSISLYLMDQLNQMEKQADKKAQPK